MLYDYHIANKETQIEMRGIDRTALIDLERLVSRYCRKKQTPLTIEQFTKFGEHASPKTSYKFLRSEVPVRFAHILQEVGHLPMNLTSKSSVQEVYQMYLESFANLVNYRERDSSASTLDEFTKTLQDIKTKHADVVKIMAEGIMELRGAEGEEAFAPTVQYFLNRFYKNRVGVRMLINQHLALFDEELTRSTKSRFIGLFDPDLNVREVVMDAASNAAELCDHYYFESPNIVVRSHNKVNLGDEIQVCYVPSHLYQVLFETFKNAMRATLDENQHCTEKPDVEVDIYKSTEDVTICIADKGGGIPRSKMHQLFDYHYTTATTPEQDGPVAPFAGYGYGLPLSRIYAQYFGGDLKLISIEGYGTEAYIYLKSMSEKAVEDVSTYNKAVAKTYSTLE